jgi:hypothetical protein
VNGREFNEIVIDPHYRESHPDIDEGTIIGLVRSLDGEKVEAQMRKGTWEYFELDPVPYREKIYRLIWCAEDDVHDFCVINCFRR